MLRQCLSVMRSEASAIIALAVPLIGALARRRDSWFNSKLAYALQEKPLNVVFTVIVVAMGLLAILITPLLLLLVLGAIALFLSLDRRTTTKLMMMGGLSTALGALTIINLPLSPAASMRLEGSPFTTNFLGTLSPYTIFGIAAIGLLTLGLKIELTPVQRETLIALVNLHRQNDHVVKGKEIAELTNRHPGTIRNQMQSLRALNLVDSLTGPRGGYTATEAAFEALSLDKNGDGDEIAVPVIKNGVVVTGLSASEIIFNKVMSPNQKCNGLIRIIGNIREFDIGDDIEIGPTPVNHLFILGKLMGRDDKLNTLVLDITGMISVPKLPVNKIARRAIRISPEASLKDASKMLINNGAHEALVEAEPIGLISLVDLASAVAEGKTNLKVRDIMTRGFLTIGSEELIFEAINILGKTGTNQLVVMNKGMHWGIITAGDLIKSLMPA